MFEALKTTGHDIFIDEDGFIVMRNLITENEERDDS